MNFRPEDWPALSKLLDQALDLPTERREAWLDSLDPDAAEYREQLRAMLASHAAAETGNFLHTLPKASGAVPRGEAMSDPALHEGALIGPYCLIRELGRGGMGTVWLAQRSDGTLKRPVALKLPHSMLPQRLLAERLARERDILAALTHPHIARLYDAGVTAQGQPYLALEYVDGESLLAWCDRRHVGLRERIALFLQALSAVQYAHAQLVVHRDLKPSNILVTAQGDLHLLDFGIAKLLTDGEAHESDLTQLGGRALTPQYASPEQLTGQPIGTASDVYSLGVILHELLCGALPYRPRRDSSGALEEAILAGEPVRPSASVADPVQAIARGTTPGKLATALKGDLDTIVLKALKKAPAERYGSVEALAEDLRRHLAGDVVLARPDSFGYHARKFVRRNWIGVSASAAVAIALLAGTGVALWQASVARREAQTSRAVQAFLEEIFQTNTANQSDPGKARQTTARDLLELGAARVDGALGMAPEARSQVLRTLANIDSEMGLREQAIELHRKRIKAVREYADADSLEVADALLALCTVMGRGFTAADMTERKALLDEAGRILDTRGDTRSILRARHYIQLSWYYLITDVNRANEFAIRGVELYRSLPRTIENVEAVTTAAVCLLNVRKPRDAIATLDEALAMAAAIGARANAGLPLIHTSLSIAHIQLGEYDAAIAASRQAYDYSRRLNGDDDASTVYAQKWLGEALLRASNYREAIRVLEPAIATAVKLRGANDAVLLPEPLFIFGVARARLGEIEEGIESISQSIRLTESNGHVPFVRAERKAALLTEMGRYRDAEPLFEAAFADRRKLGSSTGTWLVEHWNARLDLLLATDRIDEGLAQLAALRDGGSIDSAKPDAAFLGMLARAEFAAGKFDIAREHAQKALAQILASPQRGYRRDLEADLERLLGKAALASGRPDEAKTHLIRSSQLLGDLVNSARSPRYADTEVALGRTALALGRRSEARAHLRRAEAIYRTHAQLGGQYLGPLRLLSSALNS